MSTSAVGRSRSEPAGKRAEVAAPVAGIGHSADVPGSGEIPPEAVRVVDGFSDTPSHHAAVQSATGADSAQFLNLLSETRRVGQTATGYEAVFGRDGRNEARAVIEGVGTVDLPTGDGTAASFHAEAGKPLKVTVDPSVIRDQVEHVDLVWSVYPGGEQHEVPLSTGARDADGRLKLHAAQIDVPEEAFGLLKLTVRTRDRNGRLSSNWNPSNDASIAPREGAALTFPVGDEVRTEGALRAGDKVQIAYDLDRLTSLFGPRPQQVSAFVSFDGGAAQEFPLVVGRGGSAAAGGAFAPTLQVPLDATRMSVWFRAGTGEEAVYDSEGGRNFNFEVGHTRDDAEPGWKKLMLKNPGLPNLTAENFVAIGPPVQRYNCIALTLGNRSEWIDPGQDLERYDELYKQHGYQRLSSVDLTHDPATEKIVVYGVKLRAPSPRIAVTHGARMDEDGTFISKLGSYPLIRHRDAHAVSGPSYGTPVAVYARPRS